MVSQAGKAKMQMWATGNKCHARRGFTLLELLVVLALLALTTAGLSFAVRNPDIRQLELEAQRLAALFESARAQSQLTAIPVRWTVEQGKVRFEGLAPTMLPTQWLSRETVVISKSGILLGPEPLTGPQEVILASLRRPDYQLRVWTDGLRPYKIQVLSP
jgi:general secretion pathway protein H